MADTRLSKGRAHRREGSSPSLATEKPSGGMADAPRSERGVLETCRFKSGLGYLHCPVV
jgi:hypothetical protein